MKFLTWTHEVLSQIQRPSNKKIIPVMSQGFPSNFKSITDYCNQLSWLREVENSKSLLLKILQK